MLIAIVQTCTTFDKVKEQNEQKTHETCCNFSGSMSVVLSSSPSCQLLSSFIGIRSTPRQSFSAHIAAFPKSCSTETTMINLRGLVGFFDSFLPDSGVSATLASRRRLLKCSFSFGFARDAADFWLCTGRRSVWRKEMQS